MHALKRLLPFFHQLLLSFECLEDSIYLSTQEREIYGVVFFVTREIFVFVADQVELYSIFHLGGELFHVVFVNYLFRLDFEKKLEGVG